MIQNQQNLIFDDENEAIYKVFVGKVNMKFKSHTLEYIRSTLKFAEEFQQSEKT